MFGQVAGVSGEGSRPDMVASGQRVSLRRRPAEFLTIKAVGLTCTVTA